MAYQIIIEKCNKSGVCLEVCPMDAISINDEGNYVIDPEQCTDCGSCMDVCPSGAIRGD